MRLGSLRQRAPRYLNVMARYLMTNETSFQNKIKKIIKRDFDVTTFRHPFPGKRHVKRDLSEDSRRQSQDRSSCCDDRYQKFAHKSVHWTSAHNDHLSISYYIFISFIIIFCFAVPLFQSVRGLNGGINEKTHQPKDYRV